MIQKEQHAYVYKQLYSLMSTKLNIMLLLVAMCIFEACNIMHIHIPYVPLSSL